MTVGLNQMDKYDRLIKDRIHYLSHIAISFFIVALAMVTVSILCIMTTQELKAFNVISLISTIVTCIILAVIIATYEMAINEDYKKGNIKIKEYTIDIKDNLLLLSYASEIGNTELSMIIPFGYNLEIYKGDRITILEFQNINISYIVEVDGQLLNKMYRIIKHEK